jgi:hypothetical protein
MAQALWSLRALPRQRGQVSSIQAVMARALQVWWAPLERAWVQQV